MRVPRPLLAAVFVPILVLAACAPVGTRELHELVLLRHEGITRLGYAYGSAERLELRDGEHDLGDTVGEAAEERPWAVARARTIDGEPFLRQQFERTTSPPLQVARIPLTTDLRVVTERRVSRAYYYDGERWFLLGRDFAAGRTLTVAPSPTANALRGAGELTLAEADAMAAAVASEEQRAVVAFLAADADADGANADDTAETEGGEAGAESGLAADDPALASALTPRPADGLDEYRFTLAWIQSGVEVDASSYEAPPRTALFEPVASGEQGVAPGRDRFVLIRSEERLRTFWNKVHASALNPPPLPEARFGHEVLLGVRLAERESGGYGIEIERVEREGPELYVDVRLREPAEDALVTTALTTPWTLVRVLGGDARVAWFRDADDGGLFAVARPADEGGF